MSKPVCSSIMSSILSSAKLSDDNPSRSLILLMHPFVMNAVTIISKAVDMVNFIIAISMGVGLLNVILEKPVESFLPFLALSPEKKLPS